MREKILLLFMTIFLLAAWHETRLYGGLVEQEANEIMYVLLSNNIPCSKVSAKDGFLVMVDSAYIARAIKLINAIGLPHEKFVNLGDVFAQQGLVASPTEEKARFVHAISQELSETISNIDGVLIARVHIVLPIENIVSDVIFPSSASVFVKYRYGSDVAAMVPKIKMLVLHSVAGLHEKNISVILFESSIMKLDDIPLQPVSMFWIYVTIGSVLLILFVGGAIFFWFWSNRNKSLSRLRETRVNPIQAVKSRLQNTEAAEPPKAEAQKGNDSSENRLKDESGNSESRPPSG